MKTQRAKQERIIEAVRRGLEGDAAVVFLHESGYAMTPAGVARHLRQLGGRGAVAEAIGAGKTNREILMERFPDTPEEALAELPPPSQGELFAGELAGPRIAEFGAGRSGFESTRISLRIPADVHEALRIAAKVEQKTQAELITEILSRYLGQHPRWRDED